MIGAVWPSAAERMVALRYLRTREKEGFISFIAIFSLIGVALGVATLIVVLSVMNGFRGELYDRILGVNGHIQVAAEKGPLKGWEALSKRLAGVPGVTGVTPVAERQTTATAAAGGTRAITLRGLRTEDMMARRAISGNIVGGTLSEFTSRPNPIVLGDRLRTALSLRYGEELTVIAYLRDDKGNVATRDVTYVVVASFHTRRFEFDTAMGIIPLDLFQEDFSLGDGVTALELTVDDPRAATRIAGAVRDAAAGLGLRVQDWRQRNARLVGALELERVMMFIILAMIVLVASMNVVASFTMLVRTKGRGIAILRTMGATRGAVVRVFFMASASVGVVGTALGAALGLLICANMKAVGAALTAVTGGPLVSGEVDFIAALPVRVEPGEVAAILGLSLALSLAAAVYPARRAARLDPVEALRHE